ncbi:mechanosensitive ion channel family protein [Roseimarinus sediminis]|uniref:mechanosensitive ion channel family protein n=1 Tax=Roseimarinus sediminis TaxID=1610899 RepID=UPI003D23016D
MEALNKLIYNWLVQITENIKLSQIVSTTLVGLLIFLSALILLFITRKILLSVAHRIARRTNSDWDDILLKHKFFYGVAHFVPATIIFSTASFASPYFQEVTTILEKIGQLYYMFAAVYTINAFLSALNEIYNSSFSFSKERPIAGFVQLLKIFIFFVSFLAFISIVFDKDLGKLFTGLGAMAAILILVFKDSILGFVASIQISMNDMVKIGDWIDMPSRGADGTVIEINLATVKVENWDKTISNLPTYSLISESFVNWKGMEQSGGRRIKRSISIDMTSVQFCSQEMLEKFKKFVLIKDYVSSKQDEIEAFNKQLNVRPEQHYNGRRQTNLGVFRKYLEAYLHKHPMVNNEMTFLVRHLQPTDKGLPVEIYVFCKDKRWANYEAVQADIFDHILAVLPEFELRVFQAPSGNDINQLSAHFNHE